MKLRARRGSLRFRLTQGEVVTLAERGSLEESVEIAPSALFGYRLVASSRVSAMTARLEGAQITIEIPNSDIREWATGARIGLESRQDTLLILVEKDFACLEPRPGEDEDAFPHPTAPAGGGCS